MARHKHAWTARMTWRQGSSIARPRFPIKKNFLPWSEWATPLAQAGVAELADAPDLGSDGATRGGSSPSTRTFYPRLLSCHSPKGDGGWRGLIKRSVSP